MWRKGNPSTLLMRMQIGAATVESSMELPQKIKNRSAFDLVIPFLGIYPKEPKTNSKEHKHPYVHCSIFTITKIWKQLKYPSVDEWIKELWDT